MKPEVKDKLLNFGLRFGVETYLALYHDKIITHLRNFLEPVSPDDIKELVARQEPLPVPDIFFSFAQEYKQFVGEVSAERLFEFILEARPDLGEAIMSADNGAEYVVLLHAHLVTNIINAKPKEVISQEILEGKTTKVTCDVCGWEGMFTREEAERLEGCPECTRIAAEIAAESQEELPAEPGPEPDTEQETEPPLQE